jgi:hypothetical protein
MNRPAWRGFVLTLIIALAAGFAGAQIGVNGLHLGAQPRASQGSVRQSVDVLLDRDFKLTPAQKRQIEQIDESFTRSHNQIWADINVQNARLASAVATDMSLSPDAKTSIEGIKDGVGRLQTTSIEYILQVRQVLTPAQRKDFDEHVIMALMRSPP